MKNKDDILKLLDLLNEHAADDLEGQDIDFKNGMKRA